MRAIRYALVLLLLVTAMTRVAPADVLSLGDTIHVGFLTYGSPYTISNVDGVVDHPANSDVVNAGFQLAVWQIEYETSALGLTTGAFRADQSGTISGAVAEADTMLTWLASNANAPMANLVALSAP